jgi:hypothetical protein
MMKVAGIPSVTNCSGRSPTGSKTRNFGECRATNCLTASASSSTETPRNTTSFKLFSAVSASIDGISATQGPHQVAQTFRNTVFPLNSENGTIRPLRSVSDQL